MGNITNRKRDEENRNAELVEERKGEMRSGKNPPGIQRGHSPRATKEKENDRQKDG